MSAERNKETIRRIYAAMENGDLSVFGTSVHPDYVWQLAGHASWSKRFEGQDVVRTRLLKPLFAQFATQYRARCINLIAEGDIVVAEVRGDVQTKRGARYNNEYCFIFKFRGDKIAEVVEYCDTELEERILGHTTTPFARAVSDPRLQWHARAESTGRASGADRGGTR